MQTLIQQQKHRGAVGGHGLLGTLGPPADIGSGNNEEICGFFEMNWGRS